MASFKIPDLALQMGMDVIRFRDLGDCLYLLDGETLKIFQPQSVRRIGGRPDERYMSGAIAMALKAEIADLAPKRLRIATPSSLVAAPIMNFLGIPIVDIEDGEVPLEFVHAIKRYLGAMPSSVGEMNAAFGADFLSRDKMNRFSILVKYLRALPLEGLTN